MNTKSKNKKNTSIKLKSNIRVLNFRDIIETELNAQEMSQDMMRRLIKNIKRDGILTSLPLVMEQIDGKYICISGHHRIKAAIRAGITESNCIVINEIPKSARLRLQLSHNDINGTSNQEIIQMLQEQLDDEDLYLVDKLDNVFFEDVEDIKYNEKPFKYINIALIENSREILKNIIDSFDNDDVNYLIDKEEYNKITEFLTFAFDNGFKTPGQAFGKIIDIIKENESLFKR